MDEAAPTGCRGCAGVPLAALDDLLGLRVIFRPSVSKKLPVGLHRQRQCMLCYRVLEVCWMETQGANALCSDDFPHMALSKVHC